MEGKHCPSPSLSLFVVSPKEKEITEVGEFSKWY